MTQRGALCGVVLFSLYGCRPDFEERSSLITAPRILAVRAEPPESAPGQNVAYDVIGARPDGSLMNETIHWAFCAAPKPLTENNSVSAACLGNEVREISADGLVIAAVTPTDACQLFGPDTPPGDFRPRDANDTGGFYQPLRLQAMGQTVFAFERITCNLPNAPLDVAVEFTKRYVRNQNPRLLPLRAMVDGQNVNLDALPAGRDVQFEVSWESEDAERFVYVEPTMQKLMERREALRAFWYATEGVFEHDVTGRGEDDTGRTAENIWRSPDTRGEVFFWIVLRDNRGGMDVNAYTMAVE